MPDKLEVTYRKVEDLIPYARNARTHSDEQVARIASSIKEFGWTNPIIIDGENGIVAGHGRTLAARKLGLTEVPCIELKNLTETQKRAYILADNRLALDAGWDNEMLALELGDLKDAGVDLELTGFSDEELDELLATPTESADGDEDEAPEPQEDPVSKRGDVWILGAHRVMCGDSCSADDISKLFGSTGGGPPTVSLYLTDPPYNVAYEGGTKDALTIQNDNMEDGQFRQFLVDAFSMADTVMKPGAVFYIWHADSEGFNFRGACRDVGWPIRECLIWAKNMFVMGRQDYQWRHEPCLYGWKEGAAHKWYSDRSQSTVLEFDKPTRNGVHPTMKPVELFRYLIENSSKKGDVVFDSFGGSGTTLIASEETGRVARLMELDPRYVDVIVKRWQEMTGKEATLEETGATFNSLQH
jgi:site-specific DNA-methyltransferase (adenine-specific)